MQLSSFSIVYVKMFHVEFGKIFKLCQFHAPRGSRKGFSIGSVMLVNARVYVNADVDIR